MRSYTIVFISLSFFILLQACFAQQKAAEPFPSAFQVGRQTFSDIAPDYYELYTVRATDQGTGS